MSDKISCYNFVTEFNHGVLLYNALTNKILPLTFSEYSVIETLMENLHVFKDIYPGLYSSFKKSKFIIEENFDELAYIKFRNKQVTLMNKDHHITINPTLDCNVRCWYCSVISEGAKHYHERMSDEIINAVNIYVKNLIKEGNAKTLKFDWFGGEPLMYFDEVIKPISDNALDLLIHHDIPFSQQITTNATLLSKKRIEYMKNARFKFFQVSIDGNERRQNLIKSYSDKRGTYKDVFNNINRLCEIIPDCQICLRINYDAQTLKHSTDIFADLGEHTKNNITIDFQRVWQVPSSEKMNSLLKKNIVFFNERGFRTMTGGYKPMRFCSCYADSFNHYVINYNGKIFKCTARDYSDDLMIGKLSTSGIIEWNYNLLSKMFAKATFECKECEKCQLLPLCMGPCIQKQYDTRYRGLPQQCLKHDSRYNIDEFITSEAQKRGLI